MIPDITRKMSSAEFLAYTQNREERYELIEGELVEMPAPLIRHQLILFFLAGFFNRLNQGIALFAPIDVVLDDRNVYQPDFIWIAPQNEKILTQKQVQGAPDLVIEVSSQGTVRQDRKEKFNAYERNQVKEYWLIDSENFILEQYVLSVEKFVRQGAFSDEDEMSSPTLGIIVKVNEFLKEK
jgi:Uma2 family endonuclease